MPPNTPAHTPPVGPQHSANPPAQPAHAPAAPVAHTPNPHAAAVLNAPVPAVHLQHAPHGTPHGAPHAPSSGNTVLFTRNRILMALAAVIALTATGAGIGHCMGKESGKTAAQGNSVRTEKFNRLLEETLQAPHPQIAIPGNVWIQNGEIIFEPTSDEIQINATGKAVKLKAEANGTEQKNNRLYRTFFASFTDEKGVTVKYVFRTALDPAYSPDGVKSPVVLTGILVQ